MTLPIKRARELEGIRFYVAMDDHRPEDSEIETLCHSLIPRHDSTSRREWQVKTHRKDMRLSQLDCGKTEKSAFGF
jgi:hypothetical protein